MATGKYFFAKAASARPPLQAFDLRQRSAKKANDRFFASAFGWVASVGFASLAPWYFVSLSVSAFAPTIISTPCFALRETQPYGVRLWVNSERISMPAAASPWLIFGKGRKCFALPVPQKRRGFYKQEAIFNKN